VQDKAMARRDDDNDALMRLAIARGEDEKRFEALFDAAPELSGSSLVAPSLRALDGARLT
jgi:hypothetical protein